MELIEAELSEGIIGCCIRVHRVLGPGLLEKVDEEALAIELAKAELVFERQKIVVLLYDGKPIGEHRLDCLISARVVLELNACQKLRIFTWPPPAHISKPPICHWR